ncbi:hypothetical protein N8813_05520 [bacterium]|nr:hypothetical protein [bacterium]MDB4657233.1 hypothetical protein [Verrucomicrobiales bacterium]MDC0275426.1 hypothetical protein [Verrucomicrobiales bacterium]
MKISLPASDCATDDQRDNMTAYAAGGLACFYGDISNDPEGFEAVLIEETLD